MNPQEQVLRAALGIPDAASRVLVLEASAHLDWDWTSTFEINPDAFSSDFRSLVQLHRLA